MSRAAREGTIGVLLKHCKILYWVFMNNKDNRPATTEKQRSAKIPGFGFKVRAQLKLGAWDSMFRAQGLGFFCDLTKPSRLSDPIS